MGAEKLHLASYRFMKYFTNKAFLCTQVHWAKNKRLKLKLESFRQKIRKGFQGLGSGSTAADCAGCCLQEQARQIVKRDLGGPVEEEKKGYYCRHSLSALSLCRSKGGIHRFLRLLD